MVFLTMLVIMDFSEYENIEIFNKVKDLEKLIRLSYIYCRLTNRRKNDKIFAEILELSPKFITETV